MGIDNSQIRPQCETRDKFRCLKCDSVRSIVQGGLKGSGGSSKLAGWATVYKTVRPMLSDRCLSVCFVCDVGVFWPNGWMD